MSARAAPARRRSGRAPPRSGPAASGVVEQFHVLQQQVAAPGRRWRATRSGGTAQPVPARAGSVAVPFSLRDHGPLFGGRCPEGADEGRKRWRAHASTSGLGKHMIPVVLGPDGKYYVVDHHHLARALHDEGVKDWVRAIQRASRARHTAMSGSTVGRTFGSSEISRCPRSRSASAWKVLEGTARASSAGRPRSAQAGQAATLIRPCGAPSPGGRREKP
ncbi:ParB/Srx family N-terminal domain-containing protein [Pantoea ananatis]|uniref:ParB/Srx family N-terminal domain-containing protein n=1 Tax=Pantoea ananas TaxID=553 RepID=UPI0022212436|nr:ParB/Srx family N-terminal domain-containing protein [Pantoea ananatis]